MAKEQLDNTTQQHYYKSHYSYSATRTRVTLHYTWIPKIEPDNETAYKGIDC